MTAYILLAVSVLAGVLSRVCSRAGKELFAPVHNLYALNFLSALVSALFIFLSVGRVNWHFGPGFFAFAAVFALFSFLSQFTFIKAIGIGSTSLSTLLYSYGFLLPTVFGALVYREKVSVYGILGIVLIVLSVFLEVNLFDRSKVSRKWFWLSFCALCSSGAVGIFQKVFRNSAYRADFDSFLFLVFLFSAGLAGIGVLSSRKEQGTGDVFTGKFLLLALFIGFANGVCNKLNLKLSGELPSAVFFPCVNGGCILLTGLACALFFRERLTRRQIIGLFIGLAGLIIVGILQ